jgi:NAD(P)-dependent dehydrogenase (short-subunit alcohol dehydrogenase family)
MTDQQEAVALVTGAASGIGRAIASTLADEWTVYATDAATDGLADLADCETARLDVTDDSAIERVLDRVRTAHDGVDCLVNNASYTELGPVEDVPVDAVADQFEVNVYGPLRLCRAVLPGMRERGSGIDVTVVEPAWVQTGFAETAQRTLAGRDQTRAYEAVYQLFERTPLLDGGGLAVAPETVASTVQTAATTADPDSRYAVGPQARVLRATGALPDGVLDVVSRALLGIGTLLGDGDR